MGSEASEVLKRCERFGGKEQVLRSRQGPISRIVSCATLKLIITADNTFRFRHVEMKGQEDAQEKVDLPTAHIPCDICAILYNPRHISLARISELHSAPYTTPDTALGLARLSLELDLELSRSSEFMRNTGTVPAPIPANGWWKKNVAATS